MWKQGNVNSKCNKPKMGIFFYFNIEIWLRFSNVYDVPNFVWFAYFDIYKYLILILTMSYIALYIFDGNLMYILCTTNE